METGLLHRHRDVDVLRGVDGDDGRNHHSWNMDMPVSAHESRVSRRSLL